jgi:hypothetical protein
MTYQHDSLAHGRWQQMSLVTQMANIGSDVERAIAWKGKGNREYSRMAFERALELLDLTPAAGLSLAALREVRRVREALVDWHMGDNTYGSTDEAWQKYFYEFAVAARGGG